MSTLLLYNLFTLGLLLAAALTFAVIYVLLQRGKQPPTLRPMPAVESLRVLAERSIEEGREIHLALGSGGVTDATAAQTLVGLLVLERMAEQSQRASRTPILTTADPASQLLAADSLSGGRVERGWEARSYARFIAPHPAAYAAGTRGTMQRENLGLTAAVGYLGDEYLFLAAEQPNGGKAMYAPEIAATAHVETLPLVHLTARHPLLGEEIFALGAYLVQGPAHLASLILHDLGRILLLVAILAGVVVTSLRSLGLL